MTVVVQTGFVIVVFVSLDNSKTPQKAMERMCSTTFGRIINVLSCLFESVLPSGEVSLIKFILGVKGVHPL